MQCRRLGLECEGYRDQVDVLFRHETNKTVNRAVKSAALVKSSTTTKLLDSGALSRSSSRIGTRPLQSLSNSKIMVTVQNAHEDFLIAFVASNLVSTDTFDLRSNLFWLPMTSESLTIHPLVRSCLLCKFGWEISNLSVMMNHRPR